MMEEPVAAAGTAAAVGKWEWKMDGSLNVGWTAGDKDRSKLALFDMDDTLIRTKSGKTFATDHKDWLFWHDKVPQRMRETAAQGYRVVIVSNQNGVAKGHVTVDTLRKKVEMFSKDFGIEMSAVMATQDDAFRKPLPGMWKYIETSLNKMPISKQDSFFVGDAAGRPKRDGKDKDFSSGDM